MNPEKTRDQADPLSSLMQAWRIDTALPERFQEGVWRRMAVSQATRNAAPGFWSSALLYWENLVRRPVGIAACLTAFTIVGIGMGLWHAETFAHRAEAAWQDAYVQSVSPTVASLDP